MGNNSSSSVVQLRTRPELECLKLWPISRVKSIANELHFNCVDDGDERSVDRQPTSAFSVTRDELSRVFQRTFPTEKRVSESPPPKIVGQASASPYSVAPEPVGNLTAEQQRELRNAYYALCIQKCYRGHIHRTFVNRVVSRRRALAAELYYYFQDEEASQTRTRFRNFCSQWVYRKPLSWSRLGRYLRRHRIIDNCVHWPISGKT